MSNKSEKSPKLPRFYIYAARILREVKENGHSLKQELYKFKHSNLKGIYGLVAKTLEYYSEIDSVIKKSNLYEKIKLDHWKACILVYEILWRKKDLEYSKCVSIQTILSHRANLEKQKSLLANVPKKAVNQVEKPRYVRINTLKCSVEEAINGFRDEGWQLKRSLNKDYDEFLSKVASLESKEFMNDLHIKELFLFPPNTEFHKHEGYKKGSLVLQDKASCLPVHLLNPPPGSTVLDMCAAPGMKTSYLAALLNNEGTIYAVERELSRFQTLQKMVEDLGTTCIKTIHKDVLRVRENDCPNVEYILVDPSCSGSGMTERLKTDGKVEKPDLNRLKRLSGFQVIILKHALMHFPQAKRVVYSTCSIHPQENEYVVSEVLKCDINFKLVSAKKLLDGAWGNNSSTEYEDISKLCISTTPEKDMTNGFFIAVFERTNSEPQNDSEGTQTTVKKKWKQSKVNAEAKASVNGASSDLPTFSNGKSPKKQKKGKKKNIETKADENQQQEQVSVKKRKSTDKIKGSNEASQIENPTNEQEEPQLDKTPLKKTKKKRHSKEELNISNEQEELQLDKTPLKKTKKKTHSKEELNISNEQEEPQLDKTPLKKTKKKTHSEELNISYDQKNDNSLSEAKHKKKVKNTKMETDKIGLEQFKDILNSSVNTSLEEPASEDSVLKKKNKKRKSKDLNLTGEKGVQDTIQKHKKRKHSF